MSKLKPLSHDALELLRHEREIEPAPQDVRRRVLARARFSQRVSAIPVARSRAPWKYYVAGALGVGLGAVAFAAIRQQFREYSRELLPPVATVVNTAAAPLPTSSITEPGHLPQDVAGVVLGVPADPEVSARKTPSLSQRTNAGTEGTADQFDRELALLKRARADVAAGNYTAAIAAISEHTRRFPKGRLREEREALRVTALWNAGKREEARRAAERFNKLFPRSVLSAQMAAKAKAE